MSERGPTFSDSCTLYRQPRRGHPTRATEFGLPPTCNLTLAGRSQERCVPETEGPSKGRDYDCFSTSVIPTERNRCLNAAIVCRFLLRINPLNTIPVSCNRFLWLFNEFLLRKSNLRGNQIPFIISTKNMNEYSIHFAMRNSCSRLYEVKRQPLVPVNAKV